MVQFFQTCQIWSSTAASRLHGGHHRRIPSRDHGSFSTTISPPKTVEVPTVTYGYLFCPPLIDQLRPPTQRRARGLQSRSSIPGTVGHQLRAKILDMTSSLQQQMAGEPYTPYRIGSHHFRLKGKATNLKRTNPGSNPRFHFSILR
jgi:hypothetical protein